MTNKNTDETFMSNQSLLTDLPSEEQLEDVTYVSKSERKREMLELKAIGSRLMKLKPSLLDKLPLNERLRDALKESNRIHSHNAQKRHLAFIGKLMRTQELESIYELLNHLDNTSKKFNNRFHQLEKWRDRLIGEGQQALTEYLREHTGADHQHIRHLVCNAKKEAELNRPPSASRKLFKYLREMDGLEEVTSRTSYASEFNE